MPNFNMNNQANLALTPPQKVSGGVRGGKVRRLYDRINLSTATVLANDTLTVGTIPAGAIVQGGFIRTGVSLATAEVAIGTAASAGRYRAAGTLTTVNSPQWFGVAANVGTPLSAPETIIATITVANLPTSDHWVDICIEYLVE